MAEVRRTTERQFDQLIEILGGNCSDIDHNLRTVTHLVTRLGFVTPICFQALSLSWAQEEVGAPKCPDSRELCAEAGDGTDERRIVGAFGASSEQRSGTP